MDITAYLDTHAYQYLVSDVANHESYRHWRIDAYYIALLYQQLACLVT